MMRLNHDLNPGMPRRVAGMRMIRTVFPIIICDLVFPSGTMLKARAQVEPNPEVRLLIEITTQDPIMVSSKVKSVLLHETSVPPRWPTLISAGADRKNPLYVDLRSASRASYEIELGWVDGCLGGNACHYGTVRGSVEPLSENEGMRVPVTLRGGIRAYFIDSTCGAHCDDSAIGWAEGNYHYSISIKAEKRKP